MEWLNDPEFWVSVAFVLAVSLIWWKGAGQVAAMLDSRSQRIKTELDTARELRDEAQRTLEEYERKRRDALDEAKAIVEKAKEDAERLAARADADLTASLARRETMARERIAQAEAQAVAEVRAAAVELAIAAARTVLQQSVDAATGSRLLDDAIRDLPDRLKTH